MRALVCHFLSLAWMMWTGIKRLRVLCHQLAKTRVSRSWVIVLRLIIAMTTAQLIQGTKWPSSVIFLAIVWMFVWALLAPHPDQWRD